MNNSWSSFCEYIIDNYSSASKIVEVGVGNILEPSNILKDNMKNTEFNLVDIHPSTDKVIKEDIFKPTDSIYEGCNLIYSIRPPEELQKQILYLADKHSCDCIIKPFFTEDITFKLKPRFKLINYKKDVFYLSKKKMR